MRDIDSRVDIEKLMTVFYDRAFADDVIGFYFTEISHLNLEKHLPVITDFWETVLFEKGDYHNNVVDVHKHIHALSPFKPEHFDRWAKIFCDSVDESFYGPVSEKAKQRATSVATVMKIKFNYNEK